MSETCELSKLGQFDWKDGIKRCLIWVSFGLINNRKSLQNRRGKIRATG